MPPVNMEHYGIVVVILMQVGMFYFQWKKSNAATENVRKSDLMVLKKELHSQIKESEQRTEKRCDRLDEDLEKIREDAERWRSGVDDKLSKIDAATSGDRGANNQCVEFIKQQLLSLGAKVDRLAEKKADKKTHEG